MLTTGTLKRIAFAVALVVGIGSAVTIYSLYSTADREASSGSSDPQRPPGPAAEWSGPGTGGLIVPREEGPLPLGEKMTVVEAEAKLPFHFYRPDHPLANDKTIRGVFVASVNVEDVATHLEAAIDYESGIILLISPADANPRIAADPEGEYQKVVNTYPSGDAARVTTVHGVPALVIERNPAGTAYVDLVLDDVRLQFFPEYEPARSSVTATDLVSVAESLK